MGHTLPSRQREISFEKAQKSPSVRPELVEGLRSSSKRRGKKRTALRQAQGERKRLGRGPAFAGMTNLPTLLHPARKRAEPRMRETRLRAAKWRPDESPDAPPPQKPDQHGRQATAIRTERILDAHRPAPNPTIVMVRVLKRQITANRVTPATVPSRDRHEAGKPARCDFFGLDSGRPRSFHDVKRSAHNRKSREHVGVARSWRAK